MPKFLPAALFLSACCLTGCAGQSTMAVSRPEPPVRITHPPVALIPQPQPVPTRPEKQKTRSGKEKQKVIEVVTDRPLRTSLRTGDRLNISVWREDDLSRIYQIDDHGEIAFPLIGNVKAANASLSNIRTEIADRLRGDYLLNPQVSVELLPPENCGCGR